MSLIVVLAQLATTVRALELSIQSFVQRVNSVPRVRKDHQTAHWAPTTTRLERKTPVIAQLALQVISAHSWVNLLSIQLTMRVMQVLSAMVVLIDLSQPIQPLAIFVRLVLIVTQLVLTIVWLVQSVFIKVLTMCQLAKIVRRATIARVATLAHKLVQRVTSALKAQQIMMILLSCHQLVTIISLVKKQL